MTPFDYVVLAVTAVSILISIWRGLVREVMSLLSWLVALWAAFSFSVQGAEWLPAAIANPSVRYLAAFVLVFLGTVIVLELFGVLLAKLLHAAGLAFIDRLLGAVFGFARGALLAWMLTLLGGLTALPEQPWWRESLFAPPLQGAVLAARPLLPPEFAKRLKYS
ncbi:MAG: CvpA family protein [Betaproteobacteria bacterium]